MRDVYGRGDRTGDRACDLRAGSAGERVRAAGGPPLAEAWRARGAGRTGALDARGDRRRAGADCRDLWVRWVEAREDGPGIGFAKTLLEQTEGA
ncbi:hypothetical protein ABWH91_14605 [Phycisphaerales bacterium ac7]